MRSDPKVLLVLWKWDQQAFSPRQMVVYLRDLKEKEFATLPVVEDSSQAVLMCRHLCNFDMTDSYAARHMELMPSNIVDKTRIALIPIPAADFPPKHDNVQLGSKAFALRKTNLWRLRAKLPTMEREAIRCAGLLRAGP